jgi:hypothetical protein
MQMRCRETALTGSLLLSESRDRLRMLGWQDSRTLQLDEFCTVMPHLAAKISLPTLQPDQRPKGTQCKL